MDKHNQRKENFKKLISNNYDTTFVKNLEKAINRKFAKGEIHKIVIIPSSPGFIKEIKLLDKSNNRIYNKDIEEKIIKFWKFNKVAKEKNSDYYFTQRKPQDQKENIYHRSLGEESIFNY